MSVYYLSIDLGGTKCAGALISSVGEIAIQSKVKIAGLEGEEVGNAIIQLCKELINNFEEEGEIGGIGVSVPEISFKEKGTVWAPNIPGWDDYPLREKIKQNLDVGANISVDNDRACSIMGEYWLGAARECKNVIHLAFGTGIGAGILADGRILRGQNDIAGSVGWLALDDRYPNGYKQFGCFEYNASGDGLYRMALDIYSSEKGDIKTMLVPEEMNAAKIIAAYQEKDPLANKVIAAAIQYWAKGVANLISIFNPEKIIFGGGLFGPALQFLDQIYIEAKKYAQPLAIDQVRFCAGDLRSDAQLYGAVKTLMNEL